MSCKCNSSLTKGQMQLMKLITVAVYDLRVCIKEFNPGLNNFKEDNW